MKEISSLIGDNSYFLLQPFVVTRNIGKSLFMLDLPGSFSLMKCVSSKEACKSYSFIYSVLYDSVVASAIFYRVGCCSSTSQQQVGRDLMNVSRRPAPPWDALLTQCRCWERAGWWTSCHHCWWRSPAPCRSLSQHWAAPPATDWYTPSVWRIYVHQLWTNYQVR